MKESAKNKIALCMAIAIGTIISLWIKCEKSGNDISFGCMVAIISILSIFVFWEQE